MSIEVITDSLDEHPCCPHGPTLLFSRQVKGEKRNFFACAACRERRDCSFFLWQDEVHKFKKAIWQKELIKYTTGVNHRKKFLRLNQILSLPASKRLYCHTCDKLFEADDKNKHNEHEYVEGISDYQLKYPSEYLPALNKNKKEAQYLFSSPTVTVIIHIIENLGIKNVVCIGTPRIHEFILNKRDNMTSILLDLDKRFHNFFGPLQFCWYNLFNHHFFFSEAREVFSEYLRQRDVGLIIDPPFGGRLEPIAHTLDIITKEYKKIHGSKSVLPLFLVLPYFMEPQVLNWLPYMRMCDFKVEYENHLSFRSGSKGRKQGSPVRIFTNVDLSLIKLPELEYKHCKTCNRWVSKENRHCSICGYCTSKSGVTYKHCSDCKKCVKPTWQHCSKCKKCATVDHTCEQITFLKECFHCKKAGHKRSECPEVLKRKVQGGQIKAKKRKKCK